MAPEENYEIKSTMSKLLDLLIRLRFLPLFHNGRSRKYEFNVCSMSMMSFALIYWGFYIFIWVLSNLVSSGILMNMLNGFVTLNTIDAVVMGMSGYMQLLKTVTSGLLINQFHQSMQLFSEQVK